MKENKRELVSTVLAGGKGDRVPVAFWWHFIGGSELIRGYQNYETVQKVIRAHQTMFDTWEPDFMKIMTDGFFAHPSLVESSVKTVEDLSKVRPITKEHPWIKRQVELAKAVSEYAGGEILTFFNVFSPLQALRLNMKYLNVPQDSFSDLMLQYPEKIEKITETIASDYKLLFDELKAETRIDGVYYSVQNIQDERATEDFHKEYVFPVELDVLGEIHEHWDHVILHICGYDHFKNKLGYYTGHKASAYNWAVHTDGVSLAQGKRLFNAPVIGGFDNNRGTLIDEGSREELVSYTQRLIQETGCEGLVIGADCTIPSDMDFSRINVIKEAAKLEP